VLVKQKIVTVLDRITSCALSLVGKQAVLAQKKISSGFSNCLEFNLQFLAIRGTIMEYTCTVNKAI
jgi:hypothetical protein